MSKRWDERPFDVQPEAEMDDGESHCHALWWGDSDARVELFRGSVVTSGKSKYRGKLISKKKWQNFQSAEKDSTWRKSKSHCADPISID